jgi:hypothetical protein
MKQQPLSHRPELAAIFCWLKSSNCVPAKPAPPSIPVGILAELAKHGRH